MFQDLKFFLMVLGKVFSADVNFMERLKKRVGLREVKSKDESEVIIAFVPVSSRAGTDIDAALQRIPQSSQPVILVVLHHTFDSDYVTPDSSPSVTRENVFTVDCVFHEDIGLHTCLRNDIALKAVTDHLNLIFKRASVQSLLIPRENTGATCTCCTCCTCSNKCIICTLILIVIAIGIVAIALGILYGLRHI